MRDFIVGSSSEFVRPVRVRSTVNSSRLLYLENVRFKFIEQMFIEDVSGISSMIQSSIYLISPFVSLFYSFFVFDTLGDATNWKLASIVASFVALSPLVVWSIEKLFCFILYSGNLKVPLVEPSMSETMNSMMNIIDSNQKKLEGAVLEHREVIVGSN
jgi:hypothetical protein